MGRQLGTRPFRCTQQHAIPPNRPSLRLEETMVPRSGLITAALVCMLLVAKFTNKPVLELFNSVGSGILGSSDGVRLGEHVALACRLRTSLVMQPPGVSLGLLEVFGAPSLALLLPPRLPSTFRFEISKPPYPVARCSTEAELLLGRR